MHRFAPGIHIVDAALGERGRRQHRETGIRIGTSNVEPGQRIGCGVLPRAGPWRSEGGRRLFLARRSRRAFLRANPPCQDRGAVATLRDWIVVVPVVRWMRAKPARHPRRRSVHASHRSFARSFDRRTCSTQAPPDEPFSYPVAFAFLPGGRLCRVLDAHRLPSSSGNGLAIATKMKKRLTAQSL